MKTRVGDIGFYADINGSVLDDINPQTEMRVPDHKSMFSVIYVFNGVNPAIVDHISATVCDWSVLLCTSFRKRRKKRETRNNK